MATDEFGQPQDFISPQPNGTPNLGGDTGDVPRDLFGNPLNQGPQAMMNYDALLEGGELSIENGSSGAGGTDAPSVPASRFIQPVYGDELITHIPPVDMAIDNIARANDAIEKLGGEIAEKAAPMLQELREEVAAWSQEWGGKAADSWSNPNNQLRAGLEARLTSLKDRFIDLAQSDLVQQGVQSVTQVGKTALENTQHAFDFLQRVAAPLVEGALEVATGANLASNSHDSSTLPADVKEFGGKLYTWLPTAVKENETVGQFALESLGTASESAIDFIAQHNGIQNPDKIYVDQTILIPVEVVVPMSGAASLGSGDQRINGFLLKDEFLAATQKWNLGSPASDVMTHSSGAKFQYFNHSDLGRVSVVSSEHGAFPLWGGIRDHYVNVGKGLNGVLGAPTGEEKPIDNGFVKQEFENGYITWKDGVAQAYNQDGGLLFQRPAYTPPSSGGGGGTNPGALLETVGRDYFLQRSEFYTTGNIFAQSGYGSSLVNGAGRTEGNCTWYAHGRVMEMGGDPAALQSMRGNANQWHLQLSNGTRVLNGGEAPQRGDIAQWTRNGMNHVAVVEEVYQQGAQTRIKISESHYYGANGSGDGILHSVNDYTAGNPDRFIRVPGVQQSIEEQSIEATPADNYSGQKGSYEESFDARIYEEGSDTNTETYTTATSTYLKLGDFNRGNNSQLDFPESEFLTNKFTHVAKDPGNFFSGRKDISYKDYLELKIKISDQYKLLDQAHQDIGENYISSQLEVLKERRDQKSLDVTRFIEDEWSGYTERTEERFDNDATLWERVSSGKAWSYAVNEAFFDTVNVFVGGVKAGSKLANAFTTAGQAFDLAKDLFNDTDSSAEILAVKALVTAGTNAEHFVSVAQKSNNVIDSLMQGNVDEAFRNSVSVAAIITNYLEPVLDESVTSVANLLDYAVKARELLELLEFTKSEEYQGLLSDFDKFYLSSAVVSLSADALAAASKSLNDVNGTYRKVDNFVEKADAVKSLLFDALESTYKDQVGRQYQSMTFIEKDLSASISDLSSTVDSSLLKLRGYVESEQPEAISNESNKLLFMGNEALVCIVPQSN